MGMSEDQSKEFLEFLKVQFESQRGIDEKLERLHEKLTVLIAAQENRLNKVERNFMILIAYLIGSGVIESIQFFKMVVP